MSVSDLSGDTPRLFSMVTARVDITPDARVPLAGYGRRSGDFVEVADPLEANILILNAGSDTTVFVTLDLLYVGAELRSCLQHASKNLVAPHSLIVAASHTHFAPATDRFLPRLGLTDPDYFAKLSDRLRGVLEDSLKTSGKLVSLYYAEGCADHAINRRLPVFGLGRDFPFLKIRTEMRPNSNGFNDEMIRVLRFDDSQGTTQAILWSYACHPVGFPKTENVSSDFPGVVRAALRRYYGDIAVLFLQGFSGDVHPRSIAQARKAERAPRFKAFGEDEWKQWSESLANCVVDVSKRAGRKIEGPLSAKRKVAPLSDLGPNSLGRDIAIQRVSFGDELNIVGVSAEMVSEYTQLLADCFPSIVVPVGCLDGVPGYIPTSKMIAEGGYEVTGFMRLFGVSGSYVEDVSSRVSKSLFEAVR
jgi:hypothetical protein